MSRPTGMWRGNNVRCLQLTIKQSAWLGAALVSTAFTTTPALADGDLRKLQHIVIVMQENHSFDNYFGALPMCRARSIMALVASIVTAMATALEPTLAPGGGAEGTLVEIALGPLIGNHALAAIERRPVEVALEKILADLGADFLESEADVAEDRIVAADTVPLLEDIPDADRAQEGGGDEWARKRSANGMSAAKTAVPAMLNAIAAYRISPPSPGSCYALSRMPRLGSPLTSGAQGQNRCWIPLARCGRRPDGRSRRTTRIGAFRLPLRIAEAASDDQQG
jgi:hypothetical protein